ncbi:MAG: hypothetical protein JWN30_915 [Bacilli bacterium]|nr:hypothetical protein [Bacilli bacterium]
MYMEKVISKDGTSIAFDRAADYLDRRRVLQPFIWTDAETRIISCEAFHLHQIRSPAVVGTSGLPNRFDQVGSPERRSQVLYEGGWGFLPV